MGKKVQAVKLMMDDIFDIHRRYEHVEAYNNLSDQRLQARANAMNGAMPVELKDMYKTDADKGRHRNEDRLQFMLRCLKHTYRHEYGGERAERAVVKKIPAPMLMDSKKVDDWLIDSHSSLKDYYLWRFSDDLSGGNTELMRQKFVMIHVQSYVLLSHQCAPSEVAAVKFKSDGTVLESCYFRIQPSEYLKFVMIHVQSYVLLSHQCAPSEVAAVKFKSDGTVLESCYFRIQPIALARQHPNQARRFAEQFSQLYQEMTDENRVTLDMAGLEIKRLLRTRGGAKANVFCIPEAYAEAKCCLNYWYQGNLGDIDIRCIRDLKNSLAAAKTDTSCLDEFFISPVDMCPVSFDDCCEYHRELRIPFCVLGLARRAVELVTSAVREELELEPVPERSVDVETRIEEQDGAKWQAWILHKRFEVDLPDSGTEVGDEEVDTPEDRVQNPRRTPDRPQAHARPRIENSFFFSSASRSPYAPDQNQAEVNAESSFQTAPEAAPDAASDDSSPTLRDTTSDSERAYAYHWDLVPSQELVGVEADPTLSQSSTAYTNQHSVEETLSVLTAEHLGPHYVQENREESGYSADVGSVVDSEAVADQSLYDPPAQTFVPSPTAEPPLNYPQPPTPTPIFSQPPRLPNPRFRHTGAPPDRFQPHISNATLSHGSSEEDVIDQRRLATRRLFNPPSDDRPSGYRGNRRPQGYSRPHNVIPRLSPSRFSGAGTADAGYATQSSNATGPNAPRKHMMRFTAPPPRTERMMSPPPRTYSPSHARMGPPPPAVRFSSSDISIEAFPPLPSAQPTSSPGPVQAGTMGPSAAGFSEYSTAPRPTGMYGGGAPIAPPPADFYQPPPTAGDGRRPTHYISPNSSFYSPDITSYAGFSPNQHAYGQHPRELSPAVPQDRFLRGPASPPTQYPGHVPGVYPSPFPRSPAFQYQVHPQAPPVYAPTAQPPLSDYSTDAAYPAQSPRFGASFSAPPGNAQNPGSHFRHAAYGRPNLQQIALTAPPMVDHNAMSPPGPQLQRMPMSPQYRGQGMPLLPPEQYAQTNPDLVVLDLTRNAAVAAGPGLPPPSHLQPNPAIQGPQVFPIPGQNGYTTYVITL